jgi:hypothetical protein
VVTIIFLLATCCMAGRLTLYVLAIGHPLSSYCGHYHVPIGHLLHGREVNPIHPHYRSSAHHIVVIFIFQLVTCCMAGRLTLHNPDWATITCRLVVIIILYSPCCVAGKLTLYLLTWPGVPHPFFSTCRQTNYPNLAHRLLYLSFFYHILRRGYIRYNSLLV